MEIIEEKIEREIRKRLAKSIALDAFTLVEADKEVNALLEFTNTIAIPRLGYNDHGRIHARIVVLNALKILDILLSAKIKPHLIKDEIGNLDDVKVCLVLASFLHDIGMSVHRKSHYLFSVILAEPILFRILSKIYADLTKLTKLKSAILEAIFTHDEANDAISIESSILGIADGCDMTKGRARIPFHAGKFDIHSASAMSVLRVDIRKGSKRPLAIDVLMDGYA